MNYHLPEDIYTQWMQYGMTYRNHKESTYKQYRNLLNTLFDHCQKPYNQVTEQDIKSYLLDMKINKMDLNTQRLRSNAIRNFYKWYSNWANKPNPAADFNPIPEKITDPNVPTPDDLIQVVSFCNDRLRRSKHPRTQFTYIRDTAMFCFMADTGVRVSELVELKIKHIKPMNNRFEVHINAGKGRSDRKVVFGHLSEYSLVGELFSFYWLFRTKEKRIQDDPLFPSLAEWPEFKPMSIETIQGLCQRIGNKINIKMNPHSWRHFFATYSVINGKDIRAIQADMGHATISSTEKYIHIASRRSDTQAQSATAGIRVPQGLSGFAEIQRKLIEKQNPNKNIINI